MGFSDFTIKRYTDDFHMDSPFNRRKEKKKSTTKSQQENLTAKKSKLNVLKGGSFVEEQGKKSNYTTIARNVVILNNEHFTVSHLDFQSNKNWRKLKYR